MANDTMMQFLEAPKELVPEEYVRHTAFLFLARQGRITDRQRQSLSDLYGNWIQSIGRTEGEEVALAIINNAEKVHEIYLKTSGSKDEILDLAWRMFNLGRFVGEQDVVLQGLRMKFLALGGCEKDFPTFISTLQCH